MTAIYCILGIFLAIGVCIECRSLLFAAVACAPFAVLGYMLAGLL
jgi:hypothetical protein